MDGVVMRKLREVFDRCDANARGCVSKGELVQAVCSNPWLAGLFRLPRDWETDPLSRSGGPRALGGGAPGCRLLDDAGDDEVTWKEFASHIAKWPRMPSKLNMPTTLVGSQPCIRGRTSPSPMSRLPGGEVVAQMSTPVDRPMLPQERGRIVENSNGLALAAAGADPPPAFALLSDRQHAQHRHVRAWIVAQAVASCTSPARAGIQQAQMRTLARDIDAYVLSPGPQSDAQQRLAAVAPYVDLLRREALQDLQTEAAAAGITVASLSQAEAALLACASQLERALVGRLSSATSGPALGEEWQPPQPPGAVPAGRSGSAVGAPRSCSPPQAAAAAAASSIKWAPRSATATGPGCGGA